MNKEYTGLVLSGGKSSRMGSEKGLVNYKGRPLIEYPLAALKSYCSELLISANSDAYVTYGVPLIKDRYQGLGPMAGLYEGILHSKNHWLIVLSCDLPNVNGAAIECLLSNVSEAYDAVVAQQNGRKQPLFACYNTRISEQLKQHLEDQKLRMMNFLDQLRVSYVSFDTAFRTDLLVNINAPEDLE